MFANVGWGEMLVLLVVGLLVLGPERLPGAIRWTAGALRQARDYLSGMTTQLREDIGPEFDDLRGQLSVDMGSAGHAIRGLRLASGVGDYGVRVYARNRAEVVRLYDELFERDFDPLGDDFQRARRQLDGLR